MSKAQNYFKIVELNRAAELSAALRKAVKYITESCSTCPLEDTNMCAKDTLPPAAFKEDEPREGVCANWLAIHYLGKGRNA